MKGYMKCFRKIEKDPDEKYDLDKPSGVQRSRRGEVGYRDNKRTKW